MNTKAIKNIQHIIANLEADAARQQALLVWA